MSALFPGDLSRLDCRDGLRMTESEASRVLDAGRVPATFVVRQFRDEPLAVTYPRVRMWLVTVVCGVLLVAPVSLLVWALAGGVL